MTPDGASVTRYTYQGNQTTVTDPAGKWKTVTTDAMGNLATVTEPDPVSGTQVTTYTYNVLGQLLTVTMPRSSGTQTRSFVWTGSDLTSATNPENGTVTYTYDGAHRVLSRTDAKGQKTQYTYDSFGRKTMVQHYNASGVEQTSQRVTYTFDSDASGFSQNALGRLVSVQFSNETPVAPEQFTYLYSYTTAGTVATQRMQVGTGSTSVNLDAAISVDSEGKLYSVTPPGDGTTTGTPNQYVYSYDPMGRLSSLTENSCQTQPGTNCTTYATNGPTVASATYGPAGEVTGLTYDGFTETRTYNSLLQLTRMTATGSGQTVMDMQYTYSRSQNNGRIMQSTDETIAGGETVVYTYDMLNRLAKAETTSAAWGEAYTYDGFGNLTAKTPTKGTAPTMSASYDAATNHQVGQTYDANGNTGFSGTYPYDVENHLLQPLTSGTGPQWTYDPSGKRVFAKTPGNGTTVATACEIYFYGITGQKLVTYSCGYHDQTGGDGTFWYQVKSRNVYFGGKLMRSAGVTVVKDRLGSVRANSNGERMSYFPYGEERTSTADGREKFGTYFRDPAANGGLDYADQRYYADTTGRFLTPDPYMASGGPGDPGSWNRYAYVQGDPVNFYDPQGQFNLLAGQMSFNLLAGPMSFNLLAAQVSVEEDPDENPFPDGCWSTYFGGMIRLGDRGYPQFCDLYMNPGPPIGPGGPVEAAGKPLGYNGAKNDLAKADCYGMFGFDSAAAAQSGFDKISWVTMSLGQLQIQDVPGGQSVNSDPMAPPAARTVMGTSTVQINSDYSWVNFSNTLALDITTGEVQIFDYLRAINAGLGTGMSTSNLANLILLHEFTHVRGGIREDNLLDLYNNCIK